jgi:TetR/AcrR family tetracycline transcriptional repressor
MTPASDGPRLSRSLIVQTAVAQIDRDGPHALTMRQLGKTLNVEAMALYHYVHGREDLLDAVVDQLTSDMRVGAEEEIGPEDAWQGYLQVLAHRVRRVAVRYPKAFPLIATRHPAAPWLRPPLRNLDVVEDFLDAMLSRGLDDHQVIHVYRVFTSFLLGHLLLEVAAHGAETGPVEQPLDEGDPSSPPTDDERRALAEHPTLSRLRVGLAEATPKKDFEEALEALLDRLDMEFGQQQV